MSLLGWDSGRGFLEEDSRFADVAEALCRRVSGRASAEVEWFLFVLWEGVCGTDSFSDLSVPGSFVLDGGGADVAAIVFVPVGATDIAASATGS